MYYTLYKRCNTIKIIISKLITCDEVAKITTSEKNAAAVLEFLHKNGIKNIDEILHG